MGDRATVRVTSLGFCTPLGPSPADAIASGESAVRERAELEGLPHRSAASVEQIPLASVLKRRKDKKLMARPSQLALAAAAAALEGWTGPRETLGLFVGVGREPGDDGESEPALVAAQVDGRVSDQAVAGPCRDLYPPLLPLKTLPNMALAHVSIHLDVRGENGAWSGGEAAGLAALRSAIWAVEDGRCSAALVVAADSWTSAGAVRDLLRMANGGPIDAPGEAGVALLLERGDGTSGRSLAEVRVALTPGVPHATPHRASLGDSKAADALMALALTVAAGSGSSHFLAQEGCQAPVGIDLVMSPDLACYDSPTTESASD